MNCPECGHPAENHHTGSLGMGCYFEIEGQTYAHDDCRMSPIKIELHHWKAEALAAREYINKVDEFLATLPIDIQYVLPDETNVYLAAKVKEAQP